MKSIVILVFGIIFSVIASAEPLRYRLSQPVQARAVQTNKGLLLEAELPETATEGDEEQASNDEQVPDLYIKIAIKTHHIYLLNGNHLDNY